MVGENCNSLFLFCCNNSYWVSSVIPDTFASQLMIITSSALMLLSFVLYAKELKQMIKEKYKLVDEQKRN